MRVAIHKRGDQLAVLIPPEVAAESRLQPGAILDLSVQGEQIVLKPVRRLSLSELVSRISPENLHEEVDFGPPVGRELL